MIALARVVEYISLQINAPPPVQSFFWPLHNSLLSIWMGVILICILVESYWSMLQTLIWGARRTGTPLSSVWNDKIPLLAQSVTSMCESHQALSCRLVGLSLLGVPTSIGLLRNLPSTTFSSAGFLALVTMTWWYWFVVTPWMAVALLWVAFFSGFCFALIEMAGL